MVQHVLPQTALLVLCILFNGYHAAPAPAPQPPPPPRKVPPCSLGKDLLNSLVNAKNKDNEEYGIENIFGLVGEQPVDLGNMIQDDISDQELQNCLDYYLQEKSTINNAGSGDVAAAAAAIVPYSRPSHLGGQELTAIPVPIPEDEDYLPGEEGYTTYINPHNYKQQGYFEKDENQKEEGERKKKKKKKKNKKKKISVDDEMLDELIKLLGELDE